MYETSSGHNTALIIDFAPQPSGVIPPAQVATAAALGTYITSCYSAPIVQTSGNGALILTLMPSAPVPMDRIVVREDQSRGQQVRAFTIAAQLGDGSTVVVTASGSSIGNKFIQVLPQPLTVAMLTLNITAIASPAPVAGGPFISDFSAYACSALAEELSAGLEAAGFPQAPQAEQPLRQSAHPAMRRL